MEEYSLIRPKKLGLKRQQFMTDNQKYLKKYEECATERKRYYILYNSVNGYKIIGRKKRIIYRRKKIGTESKQAYTIFLISFTILFTPFLIIALFTSEGIGFFFVTIIVCGIIHSIILIAFLHNYFRIRFLVFGSEGLVYKYIIGSVKYYDINQIKNVQVKYIREHWKVVDRHMKFFPTKKIIHVDLIKKNGSSNNITISNYNYETYYSYYQKYYE